MTQEKYDLNKRNWVNWEDINAEEIASGVYSDLGAQFPIKWEGKEPVVDSADLPDGISLNDVKNAMKNNHPLI
jgi:hypothetical protein